MTATITPTQEAEFRAAFPDLVARRREPTLVKILDRFPSLVSMRTGAGATVFQTLVANRLTYTVHHCLFAGHLKPRTTPSEQPDELTACLFASPSALQHHLFSTFMHAQDGAFIGASTAFLANNQEMLGQLIQRANQAPVTMEMATTLFEAMPPGALQCNGPSPQPVADALVGAFLALRGDHGTMQYVFKLFKAAHSAGVSFNCMSLANRFSPISAACFNKNEAAIKFLLNTCEAKVDQIYFDGKTYSEALFDAPELASMITNEVIKTSTASAAADAAPSVHANKQRTRRAV